MIYDSTRLLIGAREAAKRANTARDESRKVDAGYWDGYRRALLDVVNDYVIQEER